MDIAYSLCCGIPIERGDEGFRGPRVYLAWGSGCHVGSRWNGWSVVFEAHPVGVESLVRLDVRERDLVSSLNLHAGAFDTGFELIPERLDLLLDLISLLRPAKTAAFGVGDSDDEMALELINT